MSMRAKCKRCERACYGSDKIKKFGFDCCTDCEKEIKSALGEEVRLLLLKRGATKKDFQQVANDLKSILAEW